MPLPPSIRTPLADAERYQTVYARTPGSAAAPTAGLHLTPDLLARLAARGIGTAFVPLHIGLETVPPIGQEPMDKPALHSEAVELGAETAAGSNGTPARCGD